MKFSNRIGLLSLLGVIGGAVLAGITYPGNPFLAAVFVIIAGISFVIFAIYLYNFVFYNPAVELPEEETLDDKE